MYIDSALHTYIVKFYYVDQTWVLYTSHIRHINLYCVIQFIIVDSFSILDSSVQLLPKSGLLNSKSSCINVLQNITWDHFREKGSSANYINWDSFRENSPTVKML